MPLSYENDYPQGMAAINDPNTLLLPDTERKDWRKGVLIPTIVGATAGLIPFVKNVLLRLPAYTGLWRYPVAMTIGAIAGKLFEDYRADVLAIRDAHYRQYIRNHPQDFEPPERRKVGDLLKPWQPIR